MKKLLLTLGAVASVAAPVAAVVACGSTPDATPGTEKLSAAELATANAAIAAEISAIPDTAFVTAVKAKSPMWEEVTKETGLKRKIEIVQSGFITKLDNGLQSQASHVFNAYFATKAEIQNQLKESLSREKLYLPKEHPKGYTAGPAVEIKTPMIVYSDSVSNGFKEAFTPAEFAAHAPFLKLSATSFASIKKIISEALAPKPAVAPKAASSLTATSTLTMTQFKDAITDHSTPANHGEIETALHITLPSSISVDHIYEIDNKDESGKTITLIIKQGTTSMSTETDIKVTTA